MFTEIIDVITTSNDERRNEMYVIVVMIIICFATVNALGIDTHMRTVFHFLQHCPPDVVLNSP
jgi:hypothetical protein